MPAWEVVLVALVDASADPSVGTWVVPWAGPLAVDTGRMPAVVVEEKSPVDMGLASGVPDRSDLVGEVCDIQEAGHTPFRAPVEKLLFQAVSRIFTELVQGRESVFISAKGVLEGGQWTLAKSG